MLSIMKNSIPPASAPAAPVKSAVVAALMADIREAMAPDPTDDDAVMQVCDTCGERFPRRKRKYRTRCAACAVQAQLDAAAQVSAKAGPLYERQVEAAYQHYRRERLRLRQLARERDTG